MYKREELYDSSPVLCCIHWETRINCQRHAPVRCWLSPLLCRHINIVVALLYYIIQQVDASSELGPRLAPTPMAALHSIPALRGLTSQVALTCPGPLYHSVITLWPWARNLSSQFDCHADTASWAAHYTVMDMLCNHVRYSNSNCCWSVVRHQMFLVAVVHSRSGSLSSSIHA